STPPSIRPASIRPPSSTPLATNPSRSSSRPLQISGRGTGRFTGSGGSSIVDVRVPHPARMNEYRRQKTQPTPSRGTEQGYRSGPTFPDSCAHGRNAGSAASLDESLSQRPRGFGEPSFGFEGPLRRHGYETLLSFPFEVREPVLFRNLLGSFHATHDHDCAPLRRSRRRQRL